MTLSQQLITIGLCGLATVITRFLPFVVFSERRETPQFVKYLGNHLPPAVFGLLIVYCLKSVKITSGSHGIPELIAILITMAVHKWKKNTLFSIAAGTFCYMLLLHFIQ